MDPHVSDDYTVVSAFHERYRTWNATALPHVPMPLLPRPALLDAITQALQQTGAVTLVGMSGVGKRTLWAQAAHQNSVQLPGGVVVVPVGPSYEPLFDNIRVLEAWALQALTHTQLPDDAVVDPDLVAELWQDAPAMLVVFEDVCDPMHIRALQRALPPHAQRVVTTRDQQVAAALGQPIVTVGSLTTAEALQLLSLHLAYDVATLTSWRWPAAIATQLEGLPVALALVCHALRRHGNHPAVWATLAERLLALDTERLFVALVRLITTDDTDTPALPTNALQPAERALCGTVAYCARGHDIPWELLVMLWDGDPNTLHTALTRLGDAGLISASGPDHWYQHNWIRATIRASTDDGVTAAPLVRRVLTGFIDALAARHAAYQLQIPNSIVNQVRTVIRESAGLQPGLVLELIAAMAPFQRAAAAHDEQLAWARSFLDHHDPHIAAHAVRVTAHALVEHATHIGVDRAALLDEAYAVFRAHGAALAAQPISLADAQALNDWAICALERADTAGADRAALCHEAAALCRSGMSISAVDPWLYRSLAQNLANALHEHARMAYPDGITLLHEAIAVCDAALDMPMDPYDTEGTVRLLGTKASLLRSAAECDGVDPVPLLQHALAASDAQFALLDRVNDPMSYAQQLMNRANIHATLAEYPGLPHHTHITTAISLLEQSLELRNELLVPLEYAWTQHNLALAQLTAATLTPTGAAEALQLARTAMTAALRYRTAHEVPSHALLSHTMMAVILRASYDAAPEGDPLREHAVRTGMQHIRSAYQLAQQLEDAFSAAAAADIAAGLRWRAALLPGAPRATWLADAEQDVQAALQFFRDHGYESDAGECLITAAMIAHLRDDPTEARDRAARAVTLTANARFAELPVRALLTAATIFAASPDPEQQRLARTHATEALRQATLLGHIPHQHAATALTNEQR